MLHTVVNLDRSVNGQVSFQLRDGQGNLVNFSGADGRRDAALQRGQSRRRLAQRQWRLTLPKAHGLATGDKVVVSLGAQGVLTGLTDNHVYVVEVIDSSTLRFKQVDGSAVTLAQLGYVVRIQRRHGTLPVLPGRCLRATSCSTARASPSIRMP